MGEGLHQGPSLSHYTFAMILDVLACGERIYSHGACYMLMTLHCVPSVVVAKKPESIRHEILNTLATKSHARYVCNLMLNDRVTSYVMAGAQTV